MQLAPIEKKDARVERVDPKYERRYFKLKVFHLTYQGWFDRVANIASGDNTAQNDGAVLSVTSPERAIHEADRTADEKLMVQRLYYHVRRLRATGVWRPNAHDPVHGSPEEVMELIRVWNGYIAAGRFRQPKGDPWSGVQFWIIPHRLFGYPFDSEANWQIQGQAYNDFQRIQHHLYALDGAPWTLERIERWRHERLLGLFIDYWGSMGYALGYQEPADVKSLDPSGTFRLFLNARAADIAMSARRDPASEDAQQKLQANARRILTNFGAITGKPNNKDDEKLRESKFIQMLEVLGYEFEDQKQWLASQTPTMQAVVAVVRAAVDCKPMEDMNALWLASGPITYIDFLQLLVVLLARNGKLWNERIAVYAGRATLTQQKVDRVTNIWPCVYDKKTDTYSKLPASGVFKVCETDNELRDMLVKAHPEMRHLKMSTLLSHMYRKTRPSVSSLQQQEADEEPQARKRRRLATLEAMKMKAAQEKVPLPASLVAHVGSFTGKPRAAVKMFRE